MRKTEKNILLILSWFHAVLLFASLYLFIPSFMDQSMERFHSDLISYINKGYMENLLHAAVLFIPVVFSYFLLRYVNNLLLYLVAAAAACVIIFRLTGHGITLLCTIVIFLLRCQTKIEKGRIARQMQDYPGEFGKIFTPYDWEIPAFMDEPRPLCWLIFIAEYMILILTGKHQNLTGMFALLFIDVVVTFFYMYIDRMKSYVIRHEEITNLPGRMIIRNSYVILTGIALMIFLFLMPSLLYGKEPLTGLYREREAKSWEIEWETEPQNQDDEMLREMLMQLAGEETPIPAWIIYLSEFIMWVITAIIAIFGIRMVFTFFTTILSRFAEEEEDEVISLKELQEEDKRIRKEKKKKEREMRGTAAYRIRRKYKKRILRAGKEKPLGTETPEELEINAGLIEAADNLRLRTLYEKARYSNRECTPEEEKSFPG